jgi:hypothetical protein
MDLIIPEILVEARQLSLPLLLLALGLGLGLWVAGWWTYRFWVALLTTIIAGVVGLYEASLFNMQPLLAAILLAIAAGLLALSLMRLFAFAVAGVGFLALAHIVAPSVDAPWVCFLIGGILAIILFRPWMMALTGFLGCLLLVYSGLCLLEPALQGNCVGWARAHWIMLNWICLFGTLLGAGIQFLVYRRRHKSAKKGDAGKPGGKGITGRLRILPFRKAA